MSNKYVLNADKSVSPMADLVEWSRRFEQTERRVGRDIMPDGRIVSTVFLGVDHSFGSSEPLLFETMIFPSDKDFCEEWCERCSTYSQAVKQHQRGIKEAERLAGEGASVSDTPSRG